MNIVLIGYRGAGKSAVGRVLARRLRRELVSTDAEIVRWSGESIPAIVERQGWEHFRDLESTVCRDLAGRDNLIIDTGGGAILRPQNVEVLKQNGRFWWLTAGVGTLAGRIGRDKQRPALTGSKSFVDEIAEVLAERLPKYQAAADWTVATEGLTVNQVAEQILSQIRGSSG